MKKIIPVIFLCILAAGCATSQPSIVKVDVPVYTPCVMPKIDVPDFAVDTLPLGSGIWDQMKSLRAERLQREAYESELTAAIQACQ